MKDFLIKLASWTTSPWMVILVAINWVLIASFVISDEDVATQTWVILTFVCLITIALAEFYTSWYRNRSREDARMSREYSMVSKENEKLTDLNGWYHTILGGMVRARVKPAAHGRVVEFEVRQKDGRWATLIVDAPDLRALTGILAEKMVDLAPDGNVKLRRHKDVRESSEQNDMIQVMYRGQAEWVTHDEFNRRMREGHVDPEKSE